MKTFVKHAFPNTIGAQQIKVIPFSRPPLNRQNRGGGGKILPKNSENPGFDGWSYQSWKKKCDSFITITRLNWNLQNSLHDSIPLHLLDPFLLSFLWKYHPHYSWIRKPKNNSNYFKKLLNTVRGKKKRPKVN